MKNRYIIALILLVTICVNQSVSAHRRPAELEKTESIVNIVPYGHFDTEEDISHFGTQGAEISWCDESAVGDGGSVKVKMTSGYGYMYYDVPNVIGETYDISFYAKVEAPNPDAQLTAQVRFASGQWGNPCITSTYTSQWVKYTGTYYCNGYAYGSSDKDLSKVRLFDVRYGSGEEPVVYYLDELTVTPRGNVEYDYDLPKTARSNATNLEKNIPVADFSEPVFDDMSGHWASSKIRSLAACGYVEGVGQNKFLPENNVTRAEFVTLVSRLMNTYSPNIEIPFSDVSKNDWFAQSLQSVCSADLIDREMTIGGNFAPDKYITREESADILGKFIKMRMTEQPNRIKTADFSDEESISEWAREGTMEALDYGVITGYGDNFFRPHSNITRAEAAVMIFRTAELFKRLAVYVDANKGNDYNCGTEESPLATIGAARDMLREYLPSMSNDIYVFINEGTYYLDDTEKWSVEDSGQNGFNVIYTSTTEKQPVFSMGREYRNFRHYEGNIYRTYVGKDVAARQAYFNGVRGTRASADVNMDGYLKNAVRDDSGYYICENYELLDYKHPEDLELVFFEEWQNFRMFAQSIEKTDNNKVKLTVTPKSWNNVHQYSWEYAGFPKKIENAYELLDTSGEWYLNTHDGYLYYYPKAYEVPENIVATLPRSEIAFVVAGTSPGNKINHIRFDNLAFMYSAWLFPARETGWYDVQANATNYSGDGYIRGGKEDAAVIVADAEGVEISNCTFSHLGGAGLNFRGSFKNCNIVGNHLYDLSGSGISMGVGEAEKTDYNRFVNTKENKYIRSNNLISNNLIHDVGVEYMGATGISTSWICDSEITHNEIYNVEYSGMSIGWGWSTFAENGTGTKNLKITDNYVHETERSYLADGGGIYLLGATGGNKESYNQLRRNYIENHRQPFGAIYPDEGSTFWEIADNVIDLRENGCFDRWLHLWTTSIINNKIHDNYSTTASANYNSENNEYEEAKVFEDGSWPAEAAKTVELSGLEPKYLKRYGDGIQRLICNNDKSKYFIRSGETLQFKLKGIKRKLQEAQPDETDFVYYSSNPKVASVDQNGVITGIGEGVCTIYAEHREGDVLLKEKLDIVCNDEVVSIESDIPSIRLLEGYEKRVGLYAQTKMQQTLIPDVVEYSTQNPEIATVSNDGIVHAHKKGVTLLRTVSRGDGFEIEKDFTITVIGYAQDGTDELVKLSKKPAIDDKFFDPSNWTTDGVTRTDDGGIKIASPKPSYFKEKIGNELLSFDITIHSPNGWPSLALRNADDRSDYTGTGTYLLGIKPDIIELQRFNSARRTMIFGDESFEPVGGLGYPNKDNYGNPVFGYEKRYSITVGTIDSDEGVRIVFVVNGKPIIDYTDTAEGALFDDGFFGIYAFEGDFTLHPFSDIRE